MNPYTLAIELVSLTLTSQCTTPIFGAVCISSSTPIWVRFPHFCALLVVINLLFQIFEPLQRQVQGMLCVVHLAPRLLGFLCRCFFLRRGRLLHLVLLLLRCIYLLRLLLKC